MEEVSGAIVRWLVRIAGFWNIPASCFSLADPARGNRIAEVLQNALIFERAGTYVTLAQPGKKCLLNSAVSGRGPPRFRDPKGRARECLNPICLKND